MRGYKDAWEADVAAQWEEGKKMAPPDRRGARQKQLRLVGAPAVTGLRFCEEDATPLVIAQGLPHRGTALCWTRARPDGE